jgi:TRAP-type C4-dicarboxylate transport system permease small subunit
MTRLVEFYFAALRAVIALLLAGMVILVFGNVVLRYAANSGIPVSEELARWFFVWLVFLGSIVALRDHAHLGIDTLVRKLPLLGRRGCFSLSHGLMIAVSAMFLIGSWKQFLINIHTTATVSGLSMGLYYGIGLIFGISAIVILGWELVMGLSGRADINRLMAVAETEEH